MRKRGKTIGGILLGLFLLLALAGGGRIYWAMQHYEEFAAAGAEFGKQTDNAACLHEAQARAQHRTWLSGTFAAKTFLEACLQASQPTTGFCDKVPREAELLKSTKWTYQQCQHADLAGADNCRALFGIVQEYCGGVRRKGKRGAPNMRNDGVRWNQFAQNNIPAEESLPVTGEQ